MRYMTGDELRKTLGWWFVLSIFAAVMGLTYLRTVDAPPPSTVATATNSTYDYVIVGGGTAGCVLASRLSEDPRLSILLLEAGGEETGNFWNHVPLWSPIGEGSVSDWALYTTSQKHACRAMKNQKCFWPSSKILGGNSLTNRMLYSRGSRHDYSQWADDRSHTWQYQNILPYFLKSEDNTVEEYALSDFHSSRGPLPVAGPVEDIGPLHDVFRAAGTELQYRTIDCGGGKDNIGFCEQYSTIRDGQRSSTAKDFLRPAMARSNLHVSTHSTAIKVLVSKNKAIGVEYIRNGKKRTVGARSEVVLSAGTVGTPHILMLSGIGPKAHLEKFGIPVHADLPVGSNLQDHIAYTVNVQTNESISITRDNAFNIISYAKFLLMGKGVLSSNKGIFGTAMIKTNPKSPKDMPDIQITFSAIPDQDGLSDKHDSQHNKPQKVTPATASDNTTGEGFTMSVELLHPDSRGSVRLQNTNPFTPPIIEPNYLTAENDVKTLIKGIKVARSMLSTRAFKSWRAKLPDTPYSPCIQHRVHSDAYWECMVRHLAAGVGQSSSTCSLPTVINPSKSVVDTKLRVKGIAHLRIADASVIPFSVSGDLLAPTIMIAEKAADLIRGHESVKWFRKLSEKALEQQ